MTKITLQALYKKNIEIKENRSPTVARRVRRTASIDDDAKRSLHRARESAGRLSSSARYRGTDPCKTFEHEYCKFKVNPLLFLQPVKLTEKRSDVIKPRRRGSIILSFKADFRKTIMNLLSNNMHKSGYVQLTVDMRMILLDIVLYGRPEDWELARPYLINCEWPKNN